ncbi:MAG: zinc metallopeptidase [Trueperaceae bacterium]|jgi:Zn-dependent membrane protease YugP|nr:MAG: zinc metallopeptidase [Trueperaceae bacterium]
MLILFVVTLAGTLLVHFYLRNTYATWQKRPATSGLTGAETARAILDANGLGAVRVEGVKGQLTDHYDPKERVVRLSEGNYRSPSIAAVAVAAHEVGHALQHAKAYAPLQWRSALVPVASIGANFAPWIIIAGVMLGALGLVQIGVILFGAAVLFQLVTLPVEFDASARARTQLETLGITTQADRAGAMSVLNAAALTYVAAAAASVAYLLYYVSAFMGGGD